MPPGQHWHPVFLFRHHGHRRPAPTHQFGRSTQSTRSPLSGLHRDHRIQTPARKPLVTTYISRDKANVSVDRRMVPRPRTKHRLFRIHQIANYIPVNVRRQVSYPNACTTPKSQKRTVFHHRQSASSSRTQEAARITYEVIWQNVDMERGLYCSRLEFYLRLGRSPD